MGVTLEDVVVEFLDREPLGGEAAGQATWRLVLFPDMEIQAGAMLQQIVGGGKTRYPSTNDVDSHA